MQVQQHRVHHLWIQLSVVLVKRVSFICIVFSYSFLFLFLIIERIVKDSLLSQTSTSSIVVPPPAAPRSPSLLPPPPPPPPRNEKNTTKISATPIQKD